LTFESRSRSDDSSKLVFAFFALRLCCPPFAVTEQAASVFSEVHLSHWQVVERREALNAVQEAGTRVSRGCGIRTTALFGLELWLVAQEGLDVEGFRQGV
jgi:hypothetical protein